MTRVVAPVIIIGMHRSGTSMLARILEDHGLFLGKTKGRAVNNESKLFQGLNNWLFNQAGARWDEPNAWRLWLANKQAQQLSVDFISKLLRTPRSISYLGWIDYLRYRSPSMLDKPWGWKDPLNTFTLPIWLALFPDARVVHIYRNGVDVAGSLRTRSVRQLANLDLWMQTRLRRVAIGRGRLPTKVLSLKCLELESAFGLWETYLGEASEQLNILPSSQQMVVQYEDLLTSPQAAIRVLCEFCDLQVKEHELKHWVREIDPSRAFAYTRKPELNAFYESARKSTQMIACGYSENKA